MLLIELLVFVFMWTLSIFLATVFLAYANGTNDNFKRVVRLFGSQTTSYKIAICWASVTTLAGSICAVILANTLLENFLGKGLVSDAIADTGSFHLAVALGKSFFIPLLLSLIAIMLKLGLYGLLHYARTALSIEKAWCVCIANKQKWVPIASIGQDNSRFASTSEITVDTTENCHQQYVGNFWGNSQKLVDIYLSAQSLTWA